MKKYNSFLGAFLSGNDGKSGYNAGYRKSALAELYQSQDPMKQQEAFQGLSRVDPEAAKGWQDDSQERIARDAKLLVGLGKDNPVARQAFETRIKPFLVQEYGDQAAALTLEEAMPYAQQIAGGSDGVPSQLQYFNAMANGLSPEDQMKARRIELGLDPRTSSAAIAYKVIRGGDGRERLVAVDPRTPGAIVIDGSGQQQGRSYTPTEANAMSDGSGWQAPTDPAAIKANKIVQSFIDAGFTPQQAGEMADMYLAKERPNGGTVTVDSANPYVSMTPAEIARSEAQAKADVALGMDPLIAGATKDAEYNSELNYAPQIAGAKERETKAAGAQAESDAKQKKAAKDAGEMIPWLDEAETLLKSGATGGYGGTAVDSAMAVGGFSTKGAQKTAQLRILSSKLVQKVPRFEGPQSNIDVQNYKEAAGDLANSLLPVETRLAALKTMRMLAAKAAQQQSQAQSTPSGEPQRIRIKL